MATKALNMTVPLVEESVNAEERLRLGLLMMGLSVLIVIAISSVLSKKYKTLWSSVPVVGSCVGIMFSLLGFASHEVLWDQIQFLNQNVFFSVLVPPIVFSSGFVLMGFRGEFFFKKLGTILWYALFGTFLSIVINFLIFWLCGLLFISTRLSLRQAFTLSTILSATDLSAVQPLFRVFTISPLIQTITLGETMFNDGVAFGLYRLLSRPSGCSPLMILTSLLQFVLSMVGGVSLAVGLPTLVRRFLKQSPTEAQDVLINTPFSNIGSHTQGEQFELILILSLPWLSYLLGESLGLQGIIVCMFAGIATGRYVLKLYGGDQPLINTLKHFFECTTLLAEASSFIFLGVSLSLGKTILKPYFDTAEEINSTNLPWWIKPVISSVSVAQVVSLHLIVIICVSITRLLSVNLTSAIVNQLIRARSDPEIEPTFINAKDQLFIGLCGGRGAMAVALALKAQNDFVSGSKGSVIVSAALTYTLFTVFLTVLLLPKLTSRLFVGQSAEDMNRDVNYMLRTTRSNPDGWDMFVRTLRRIDQWLIDQLRILSPVKPMMDPFHT